MGSKCYKMYQERRNYESAASACLNKSAILASLINREHQTKIVGKWGKRLLFVCEGSLKYGTIHFLKLTYNFGKQMFIRSYIY